MTEFTLNYFQRKATTTYPIYIPNGTSGEYVLVDNDGTSGTPTNPYNLPFMAGLVQIFEIRLRTVITDGPGVPSIDKSIYSIFVWAVRFLVDGTPIVDSKYIVYEINQAMVVDPAYTLTPTLTEVIVGKKLSVQITCPAYSTGEGIICAARNIFAGM